MDEYCVDGKMGKGIYMYLFCKLMKHTEDVGNFELSIKFKKNEENKSQVLQLFGSTRSVTTTSSTFLLLYSLCYS